MLRRGSAPRTVRRDSLRYQRRFPRRKCDILCIFHNQIRSRGETAASRVRDQDVRFTGFTSFDDARKRGTEETFWHGSLHNLRLYTLINCTYRRSSGFLCRTIDNIRDRRQRTRKPGENGVSIDIFDRNMYSNIKKRFVCARTRWCALARLSRGNETAFCLTRFHCIRALLPARIANLVQFIHSRRNAFVRAMIVVIFMLSVFDKSAGVNTRERDTSWHGVGWNIYWLV